MKTEEQKLAAVRKWLELPTHTPLLVTLPLRDLLDTQFLLGTATGFLTMVGDTLIAGETEVELGKRVLAEADRLRRRCEQLTGEWG